MADYNRSVVTGIAFCRSRIAGSLGPRLTPAVCSGDAINSAGLSSGISGRNFFRSAPRSLTEEYRCALFLLSALATRSWKLAGRSLHKEILGGGFFRIKAMISLRLLASNGVTPV